MTIALFLAGLAAVAVGPALALLTDRSHAAAVARERARLSACSDPSAVAAVQLLWHGMTLGSAGHARLRYVLCEVWRAIFGEEAPACLPFDPKRISHEQVLPGYVPLHTIRGRRRANAEAALAALRQLVGAGHADVGIILLPALSRFSRAGGMEFVQQRLDLRRVDRIGVDAGLALHERLGLVSRLQEAVHGAGSFVFGRHDEGADLGIAGREELVLQGIGDCAFTHRFGGVLAAIVAQEAETRTSLLLMFLPDDRAEPQLSQDLIERIVKDPARRLALLHDLIPDKSANREIAQAVTEPLGDIAQLLRAPVGIT